MPKKVGKYEIGKTLGEGTFGKVKFAVNTETDQHVAIKVLDKEKIQKQNMGAQIKKEISIMKMVRHDHVVQLKEVLASRTKIFIVLELITGGELFDKIVAVGRFDEPTARYYFHQLVNGVQYCHTNGVCHRDLKPENLLLDEGGNLKISDFGLSAMYDGSMSGADGGMSSRAALLHTTCGTPNYVAPEVLADKGYDGKKADVWSIGVILYVLLAGFLPFDEPTMSALFKKIQRADFSYPSWFTPMVRDMLNKVLVADPESRLGLSEIEQDPWYTSGCAPGGSAPPPPGVVPLSGAPPAGGSGAAAGSGGGDAAPTGDGAAAGVAAGGAGGGAGGGGGGGGGGGMASPSAVQPSAADLAAAIAEGAEETDIQGAGPGGAGAGGLDHEHAQSTMNAFELVNMCGGLALNRMFRPEAKAKPNADGKGGAGGGGPAQGGVKRFTQFIAEKPAAEIMSRTTEALQSMGCELTVKEAHLKIQAISQTPKGAVGVIVQLYRMADALHFVEIRRGKGDIFEFHALYKALLERLGDLKSAPDADADAAAAAQ